MPERIVVVCYFHNLNILKLKHLLLVLQQQFSCSINTNQQRSTDKSLLSIETDGFVTVITTLHAKERSVKFMVTTSVYPLIMLA